ncbi:MAG: 3-deoxy-7-phosphoheptulonate synthase, partial [Chloroflexota bacterium]
INDPHLDGSFAINEGIHIARRLILDLVALGLPAGCEFLDPISPQFTTDLVTWAAIGARTTESQVHRELASGLSMPVGFKNGTGGGIQMAIDAVRAAAHPHSFLGVTEQGLAGIVATKGNPDCHVILRGGRTGPNYDRAHVERVLGMLTDQGLSSRLMIDVSHDNAGKDHHRQPLVARDVAGQVARGQRGIVGVMIESFLVDGRQDLVSAAAAPPPLAAGAVDRSRLVYGQSVTDACIGWETTDEVLRELAAAVRARRAAMATRSPVRGGGRTTATPR